MSARVEVLEIDAEGNRWIAVMDVVERQPLPRDTPIFSLIEERRVRRVYVHYGPLVTPNILNEVLRRVEGDESGAVIIAQLLENNN